ncbi:MAG TPA: hypothetical protein PK722_05435 [Kiritimatiellia bacterium]|nr:hypothetical protein [Kiritimatiellia bacterium]
MDAHRSVGPSSVKYVDVSNSFSALDFVDDEFGGNQAVKRCFSLSHSFRGKTLIIEDIPSAGIIDEEHIELLQINSGYECKDLKRLSFWRTRIGSPDGIEHQTNDDLIGYAILKLDHLPGKADKWHIFEAAFKKYEHEHNCVPCPGNYNVNILDKRFTAKAILYCQQNGLNKACAHVALRSLLSRLIPQQDISYKQLNEIAAQYSASPYRPADGLNIQQMQEVLKAFGVKYADLDYDKISKYDPAIRTAIPYQKYLYAGIESGCGGLLGFSMSGPQAKDGRHIIPFYGHTFNKDTWAPDADVNYFNIGGGVGYIPSEVWTSSFLGHDDNFGPNFCVPRLYVSPEQVQYVVELKRGSAQYGGIVAEAQALQFLYSLNPQLNLQNVWLKRLQYCSLPHVQQVVLRAICISREEYISHLESLTDWDNQTESANIIDVLIKYLPELLWVVEVSIPHLFPANEHKLGEILLNALQARDSKKSIDYKLFMLARFPAKYFLLDSVNQHGPSFLMIPSQLISHTPVFRTTQ